jgi:hypothetical protein
MMARMREPEADLAMGGYPVYSDVSIIEMKRNIEWNQSNFAPLCQAAPPNPPRQRQYKDKLNKQHDKYYST